MINENGYKYRKLSELKKLENNPRRIKANDLKKLMKSIEDNKDYFEARPIILSDRTGELVIIGGNMRYEAAKKIGMKEVPTFLMEGLSEEREREIVIRDNVNNGEWDYDILANEWGEENLDDWGLDLNSKIENEGAGEIEGDVKFTEYLNEEMNYVVLCFDNDVDWIQAETVLGIKKVKNMDGRGREVGFGVGRILDGREIVERLRSR